MSIETLELPALAWVGESDFMTGDVHSSLEELMQPDSGRRAANNSPPRHKAETALGNVAPSRATKGASKSLEGLCKGSLIRIRDTFLASLFLESRRFSIPGLRQCCLLTATPSPNLIAYRHFLLVPRYGVRIAAIFGLFAKLFALGLAGCVKKL